MGVLSTCVCITPGCLIPTEARKEITGSPRLEVQMVMSLHVGAGN